jgi:hypothetical protein
MSLPVNAMDTLRHGEEPARRGAVADLGASGRPEAPSSATARRRAGSSPWRRVSMAFTEKLMS